MRLKFLKSSASNYPIHTRSSASSLDRSRASLCQYMNTNQRKIEERDRRIVDSQRRDTSMRLLSDVWHHSYRSSEK